MVILECLNIIVFMVTMAIMLIKLTQHFLQIHCNIFYIKYNIEDSKKKGLKKKDGFV